MLGLDLLVAFTVRQRLGGLDRLLRLDGELVEAKRRHGVSTALLGHPGPYRRGPVGLSAGSQLKSSSRSSAVKRRAGPRIRGRGRARGPGASTSTTGAGTRRQSRGGRGPEGSQLLEERALPRGQARRDDDAHPHELVPLAALQVGDTVARQAEGAPAAGLGRDLHRDLPPERRHLHLGAERRLPRRDRQLDVEIVLAALEDRMRRHVNPEVEVPARAAADAGAALAGRADAGAIADTGGDLHLHPVAPRDAPGAAARGACRLPLPAGAAAGAAHPLLLELHRPPGAGLRLLEADLDLGLEVAAAPPARAAPERPAVLELDALEPALARAEIAEDRAEEFGEAAEVARLVDVDPVAAARTAAAGRRSRPRPASA